MGGGGEGGRHVGWSQCSWQAAGLPAGGSSPRRGEQGRADPWPSHHAPTGGTWRTALPLCPSALLLDRTPPLPPLAVGPCMDQWLPTVGPAKADDRPVPPVAGQSATRLETPPHLCAPPEAKKHGQARLIRTPSPRRVLPLRKVQPLPHPITTRRLIAVAVCSWRPGPCLRVPARHGMARRKRVVGGPGQHGWQL